MQAMVSCTLLQIHLQSVQSVQFYLCKFIPQCLSNFTTAFVPILPQYLCIFYHSICTITPVYLCVQVLVTRVCSRRWWVVGRPRRKPTKSQLANTRFQAHCSKRKHEKLEILKFVILVPTRH